MLLMGPFVGVTLFLVFSSLVYVSWLCLFDMTFVIKFIRGFTAKIVAYYI